MSIGDPESGKIFPICWLTISEPGPYPEPFIAHMNDNFRFKNWLYIITKVDNPIILYKHVKQTYSYIISQNPDYFNIDCSSFDIADPVKKEMRNDVFDVLSEVRTHFDFNTCEANDPDKCMESIIRILLFANFQGNSYCKNLIYILLPIYHVVFYGIFSLDHRLFSLDVVDAFSAYIFIKLLNNPPIFFKEIIKNERIIDVMIKRLGPSSSLFPYLQPNASIFYRQLTLKKIIFSWKDTLFSTFIPFEKVIKLWDWILVESLYHPFQDAIFNFTFGLLKILESFVSSKNVNDFFEFHDSIHLTTVLKAAFPFGYEKHSFPLEDKNSVIILR